MAVCINKNSIEYQLLKDRAGISEFTLEAICRDFTEKYGRFPHLDELPNSNSEQSLRDTFKIKENNGVKISDLLEITGKETVEQATIDINNQYRDLEVKILPIVEEAIVDVAHRPIDNNFENLTEEEKILAKAPRDKNGNLLAPNGNISNLTESQYVQVRTKAFKNWFGDWINNPSEASKVVDENGEPLVVYHRSPNKFDTFDTNKFGTSTDRGQHGRGFYFGIQDNHVTYYENKYEVFLNIKNPYYITDYDTDWISYMYNRDYQENDVVANRIKNKYSQEELDKLKNHDGVIDLQNDLYSESPSGRKVLVTTGLKEDIEFVVPKSNQIKSAESNSGSFNKFNKNIYDAEPNGYLVLNNALQKLASLYGITFNEITDAELNSEEWSNLIPDAQSVNAFVYNGQIYINMDRANLDAPIHEMFHILVGSMRFENPTLYTNLISSVENLYNYSALAEQYPNRSRNDVNEEIFITELSKYFSGLPSQLMNLDQKSMHELTYNIIRTLDSILMGEDSVRTVSEDRLYNMSFKTLINEVNSTIATSKFTGFINMEGSELHRKLNNIKSDLLKNKQLEEICD